MHLFIATPPDARWKLLSGCTFLVVGACSILGVACDERGPSRSDETDRIAPSGKVSFRGEAWPELPRGVEELESLVATRVEHSDPSEPDLETESLRERLSSGGTESFVAGWDEISRALSKGLQRPQGERGDSLLLVGCYHDSGGQIDAFRRLVGPGGVSEIDVIAVELFRAKGHWASVASEEQAGDDEDLHRFLRSGDGEAFLALRRRQLETNYTAWRYGYVDNVMELVTSARATKTDLMGCDMPLRLAKLVDVPLDQRFDNLREIHCLRALNGRLDPQGSQRRIVMLWGQKHLMSQGIRRFVKSGTSVVSVFLYGHRAGTGTVESELETSIVVNEPILFALDDARTADAHALLLPGPKLGGAVERSKARAMPGEVSTEDRLEIVVTSEATGVLTIGSESVEVGETARKVVLGPGSHRYVLRTEQRSVYGRLEDWGAGRVELDFDPRAGTTRIIHLVSTR